MTNTFTDTPNTRFYNYKHLLGRLGDLHPLDNAHTERTKKSPLNIRGLFSCYFIPALVQHHQCNFRSECK